MLRYFILRRSWKLWIQDVLNYFILSVDRSEAKMTEVPQSESQDWQELKILIFARAHRSPRTGGFEDLKLNRVNAKTTPHWLCSCQISLKIEFQNFQIGIFASKNYQKYFLLKILKTTINGSNLSKYELPTPSGSWDRSILLNGKPDFGKSEMSNVKK